MPNHNDSHHIVGEEIVTVNLPLRLHVTITADDGLYPFPIFHIADETGMLAESSTDPFRFNALRKFLEANLHLADDNNFLLSTLVNNLLYQMGSVGAGSVWGEYWDKLASLGEARREQQRKEQEPTSRAEYEKLEAEVERLRQLIAEHGIDTDEEEGAFA